MRTFNVRNDWFEIPWTVILLSRVLPYVNPMVLTFLEHMKNIMLSLQGIFSTKLGKIQIRRWKTKRRLNVTLPSSRAPYMFNMQAFRRVREDDTQREDHIKGCAHTNIFYTEMVA